MSSHISQAFSDMGITIGPREILGMDRMLLKFEMRDTNILALNGVLLGVHGMAFTPPDRSAFFDLFGLKESVIQNKLSSIDFREILGMRTDSDSVDNPKVASDAFNLTAVWIIHLAYTFIKDEKTRLRFQHNVAKYLHYKFFTSIVNNSFKHGADEGVMLATISTLTKKSHIIQYGTWKNVFNVRCDNLLDKSSNHIDALRHANDDKKFLMVITDIQTRIRDMVKIIAIQYYNLKASGVTIANRSATTEVEGTKVLTQSVSTFDAMISNTFAEVPSIPIFIDRRLVMVISRQATSVSVPMLRKFLTQISIIANQQALTNDLDKVVMIKNKVDYYIGIRALISGIIQSSYRYCIQRGISLSDKASLFIKIRDAHRSSRITDDGIMAVRKSLEMLVDMYGDTPREATKASLRSAFIMYIIAKSMKYL